MSNFKGLPVPAKELVFICRMCPRMAEQWAKGQKNCHEQCGGPRKGMTFPMYNGPMTPSYIKNYCFVCGECADMTASVQEESAGLELGICKRHMTFLGIESEKLEKPTAPEQLGVVESSQIKEVSLYDLFDIDPVNDLGFEPEKPEEGLDK
jgi:hypothetical protein